MGEQCLHSRTEPAYIGTECCGRKCRLCGALLVALRFSASEQIVDLERQLAELRTRNEALEGLAHRAIVLSEEALATLRKHGFVFNTPLGKPDAERSPAEMWEKLAFSFYTDLAEMWQKASALLEGGDARG